MFNPVLLHLLHLCDPALPVGSFSHSAGLETYVQAGKVNNKESARAFIAQQLSENLRHNDAAIVSLTWDAAQQQDPGAIQRLDELCTATKLPLEMRSASQKLGMRLMKIFSGMATSKALTYYIEETAASRLFGHYCIAFSLIAHGLSLPKQETLTGFYYNAASGFTTNCVKLVPLGQQHGQEIIISIFPMISELVKQTLSPDLRLLGLCCNGFDLACMQHETLYSRLYMS